MADECATCGDPQSQHKGGKGGCRHCEFGCGEFVPETAAQPAVEPVPAEELASLAEDLAGLEAADPQVAEAAERLAETTSEITSAAARLRETERELGLMRASNTALGVDLDLAQQEIKRLSGKLTEALAAEERAKKHWHETAGQRDANMKAHADAARQLTAERDGAAEQWADAREEIERLRGEISELSLQLLQAEQLDAPTGTDALLAQADATKVPAITATSDSIRDLIGQLREQLAEHESREELREELARIEQRATEIRRVLAEADKPPAPTVPDKTVRDWARKNGFDVDARGRVPAWLRTQYLHAQTA